MPKNRRGFYQRSRVAIIACILNHANEGSRKTHLIYKCNLSLSQFNLYAECLFAGDLLIKILRKDGAEIYETTEKGQSFLEDYERISKVLEEMSL